MSLNAQVRKIFSSLKTALLLEGKRTCDSDIFTATNSRIWETFIEDFYDSVRTRANPDDFELDGKTFAQTKSYLENRFGLKINDRKIYGRGIVFLGLIAYCASIAKIRPLIAESADNCLSFEDKRVLICLLSGLFDDSSESKDEKVRNSVLNGISRIRLQQCEIQSVSEYLAKVFGGIQVSDEDSAESLTEISEFSNKNPVQSSKQAQIDVLVETITDRSSSFDEDFSCQSLSSSTSSSSQIVSESQESVTLLTSGSQPAIADSGSCDTAISQRDDPISQSLKRSAERLKEIRAKMAEIAKFQEKVEKSKNGLSKTTKSTKDDGTLYEILTRRGDELKQIKSSYKSLFRD